MSGTSQQSDKSNIVGIVSEFTNTICRVLLITFHTFLDSRTTQFLIYVTKRQSVYDRYENYANKKITKESLNINLCLRHPLYVRVYI